MAKSRGNICRILRAFLKLFAVACFLNLAEEAVCTAAISLDKTSTNCDSIEGSTTCNEMDLTNVQLITNYSAAFKKLTQVPRLVQGASNLIMLNMSHNRLSFFDASDFQKMKKLQNLDLSFNQLSEVNLTGEVLSMLKTLNLSNNRLRIFNIDGSKVEQLRYLNLNNNNIQNNLNFLQYLPKINYLFLDSNRISKIDRCVKDGSYLQTLSLRDNRLTNVSFLSGCTYLHYLDLSSNNISVIHDVWRNKSSILSYLSTANNSIENADFLRTILVSTALIHLDISHNKIKHINDSLIETNNKSQKIIYINVSYNELDDLSFVTKIKGTDTLIADNNNISSIGDFSLPLMTKLSLSHNNLSKLNFLTNLPKLEFLNLGSNVIDDIENNFKNLIELRSLDLSNNRLSNIEISQNARNFTSLNISSNKLKKLPCNEYLQSLYIDGNDISDLKVKCMPRLRTLSVFGTLIQNKYSIPLYEAKSISFRILDHHAVQCVPTDTGVMSCSKACDTSSLNEVFCSRVVNTTSPSIYIGLSVGVISLFMVLLLIRYRWRMKRAPMKMCTCITRMEERRTNVNNLDRSASYLLKISLLAVSTSVLLCIIQGGVSAAANFNSALQIKPTVYIHSYSEHQYFRGVNVKRRDFLSEQHRSRFTRTTIPGADKHHSANIYSTAQDVQETVQCQMNAVVNSGSQRHETNYNTIALKMSVNEENKLLDLYIGFSDVLSSCTCFNRSLTDLKCHSKNAVNIGFSDKLLKSIQKLSATHNNLTAVLFISRDDGLLSLHINNKVNNINIRVLRLMEDLTELDLSRNELTELDITQSKLKFLTHINVSFNKLEKFNSKSFQIKELNMSRNYIKDISFVNFLTDLEQLDLSHNKIKYISNETFQGLSKLNQLYLDHNYIVDTIFLTHLNRKISSLHLSNNLIEHVLTYLNTEFISLTDVYLDCNAIADSDFSTIPLYLDILNLTNNKISKVTGLSKSNLIYLYLANNSLSNIKFISSMTNLRYIDLSNNNLQHIDYDIVINTSNPNIELNLESTNLSSVNFIARSLDKVAILNVNNNNISCFPLSKMRTGNLRLYIENNPVENLFCPSSQREKLSKCEVCLHSREWENYIEVFWTDPNTNNFLSCLKRKNVLDICHVDLCSGVKIQNISYHLLILSCIFLIIE